MISHTVTFAKSAQINFNNLILCTNKNCQSPLQIEPHSHGFYPPPPTPILEVKNPAPRPLLKFQFPLVSQGAAFYNIFFLLIKSKPKIKGLTNFDYNYLC